MPKERSRYLQPLRRKSRLKKNLWRPLSGETEMDWGPISRMIFGVAKAYIVLTFRRSQAPRSAARRLRRNLEMAPYEKCTFRNDVYYVRAIGKNTNDGVGKELLHTRRDRSRT